MDDSCLKCADVSGIRLSSNYKLKNNLGHCIKIPSLSHCFLLVDYTLLKEKVFFFTPVIVEYMSYLNIQSFCNEMNEI